MNNNMLFITKFYYNNNLISVYYDLLKNKFSIYDVNGFTFDLTKNINKIIKKRSFYMNSINKKNIYASLLSLLILANTSSSVKKIDVEEKKLIEPYSKSYMYEKTDEEVKNIVEEYNLYKLLDKINLNKLEFLSFYSSIKEKPFNKLQKQIFLETYSFYIDYKEYIDLYELKSKIKKLSIKEDILSSNSIVAALFTFNNLKPVLTFYVDDNYPFIDDVIRHEYFHLYSINNFKFVSNIWYDANTNSFIKGINDNEGIINLLQIGILLEEGCAELLCTEYGNNECPIYTYHTSVIKILCETFGRDLIIKSFLENDGLVYLANEMLNLNYDYKEVCSFLLNLDIFATMLENSTNMCDYSYEKYYILESLLELYERKTGNSYQDNLDLLVAISSITKEIPIEKLGNAMSIKEAKYKELFNLVISGYNPTRLILDNYINNDCIIINAKNYKNYFAKKNNSNLLYVTLANNNSTYEIVLNSVEENKSVR